MKEIEREKWIKSYKKSTPHWAVCIEPSKLLTSNFMRLFNKEKIYKEKILEIGCGNGRDSIYLVQRGYNVIGIDITSNAIALARNNKKYLLKNKSWSKNLKFIIADAENLPFPDNYFDAIYSIGVLHCTNLRKSLKEAVRVLKDDSIGVVHFWEETLMIKTDKLKILVSAPKVKSILRKLPIKILSFKNKITTNKIDDEGKKNAHKHYAIIFSFKKLKKPQPKK